MITWQDYEQERNKEAFLSQVIAAHEASEFTRTARIADDYDKQRNRTISNFSNMLYTDSGQLVPDKYAANNRIASNLFNRLNTQRCMYSLGNGVTFATDGVGERLDNDFDTKLRDAGYYALIHGISFMFLNVDHVHVFPVTEFAPLWDEMDGRLRGGVRYWRVDASKPMTAVLYTEDGYEVYRTGGKGTDLHLAEPMRAYKMTIAKAPADEDGSLVGEDNYGGALPIVPLWGSRLHQSTLIGMREAIDSYDLVRSGFANDLQDCAQIYWIMENYGGMQSRDELAEFRARLKLTHIAAADTGDGGKIAPYTQEIPYAARGEYLAMIRKGIYEDFGGMDVTAISASNQTATAIQAAYQPMDENADDFEYQLITTVRALLSLIGVDDIPVFKRNRISNQLEQVQMVMQEAAYLDEETVLRKLPNVTADEIPEILERRINEGAERFGMNGAGEE